MFGNPNNIEQFNQFVQWFRSLYDIQWNFFGFRITLMNVLLYSAVVTTVSFAFARAFGMTQEFDNRGD